MALLKIKPGDRFGRLVVEALDHYERTSSGRSKPIWKCKCDCGNYCYTGSHNLQTGDTKSCGCLKAEINRETALGNNYGYKHGGSHDKLYKQYIGIKQRCLNDNAQYYDRYGGRGIKICDEWLNGDGEHTGYELYKKWAYENGYDPNAEGISIHRVDNDGDYTPDNCIWTDQKTQMNNTSANVNIEWNGQTHTISEWAEILGMERNTLENRLCNGWSVEKAFTEPLEQHVTYLEFDDNVGYDMADWQYITGLPQSTISSRLARLNEAAPDYDGDLQEYLFAPGRKSFVNAIYFVDDEGRPISEEDYNNGVRVGRPHFSRGEGINKDK